MRQNSKEDYSIYKLKKGDTLASVAVYFEKTQDEIKGYHNLFFPYEQHIISDFPENLSQLYVYPQLHFKAMGIAQHLAQDQFLIQRKSNTMSNYTVQYRTVEGEKIITIDFEISLEHQKQFNEGHLYTINKIAPTTLNGEYFTNDTEEVKEKILDAVYPIEVMVNNDGTWHEVLYDKKVMNRFATAKKEILEFYQGETVQDLLDHAQKVLADEESFKELFAHNWLLDTLFSNVYRYYNPLVPIKEKLHFALLNHAKPLSYIVEQKVEEYREESKTIIISKKGLLNDPRTRSQFETEVEELHYDNTGEKEAKGSFEQKITLNLQTFATESIYLRSDIELQTPRSVEIKMRRF